MIDVVARDLVFGEVSVLSEGVDVRDRTGVEDEGDGNVGVMGRDRSKLFREDLSEAYKLLPQTFPLIVVGVLALERGFLFSKVDVIEGWIEGKECSETSGVVLAMSLMAGQDALSLRSTGRIVDFDDDRLSTSFSTSSSFSTYKRRCALNGMSSRTVSRTKYGMETLSAG